MKRGLLLLVAFLLVGCNDEKIDFLSTNDDQANKEQQQQVAQIVKDDQRVRRVTALFTTDAAIVGIEVKPFSKWKKQQYEKEWQKEIEKALPNKNVLVSTDLKIILETDKLIREKETDKKINKKIEKLKALTKEET
jgi:hypothetical protein